LLLQTQEFIGDVYIEVSHTTHLPSARDVSALDGILSVNGYLSSSVSWAAQAHITFSSLAANRDSGWRALYDGGGILPFEMTPQMDSNSSRRRCAE